MEFQISRRICKITKKGRTEISFTSNEKDICTCNPYRLKIDVDESREESGKETKEFVDNALDSSGLYELRINLLPLGKRCVETKSTSDNDWVEWFNSNISVESSKRVIPDTNFIMRRYGSNFLLPLLGHERFGFLKFRIPNLVIFEIEDRCNRAKKGFLYLFSAVS